MNIFTSIINNNLSEVKTIIENGLASFDTLEPTTFEGKYGETVARQKQKSAMKLAKSLNRQEIVDYFCSLEGGLTHWASLELEGAGAA